MKAQHQRLVRLATRFDADTGDGGETIQFTLPEDLAGLSDEELAELQGQAVEAFNALYEADADLSSADVEAMQRLADATEAIRAEDRRRETERAENRQQADELAQRVRGEQGDGEGGEDGDAVDGEDGEQGDGDEGAGDDGEQATGDTPPAGEQEETPGEEPEDLAASTRGPTVVNINLGNVRRRQSRPPDGTPGELTLVAAADLPGHATGSRITLRQALGAFADKSRGINPEAMRTAHARGQRTLQSIGIGSVQKNFPDDLIVNEQGSNVDEVIARAVDESRLPGGSLTAAAGWCSPSETLYDLAEAAETTEGLFSLPEIQVVRGGIRHTLGPDFSSIFGEDPLSWNFTEYEVEQGDFDGEGGGTKPCFFVECPDFSEVRLDVAGICIRAGLLPSRTYPEVLERLGSGAVVAHEFKQARRKIGVVEAGSTAVAMPAGQLGAVAPVLTAIELQVEDYRQRHRLGRARSLEAVFPMWVRGAIRSDLSRRLGVDLLSVSNEQINGWFTQRGVNAQFVYELDDLTGDAADRTSWPTSFKFLLYLAGTWVAGTQAVITLEGVFDSALVEQNIFTQLFTEEGWLVAKRWHDSRVVTVPICPDGTTHGGVDIDCDGTAVEG